jgi:O-antigen/teichoic acid export membrane protein
MELNELKEVWTALDNRLKRNEELKESIILEMMKSKAGKLVNRFITIEIFSAIFSLLAIPFCMFLNDRYGGSNWAQDTIVISGMPILFLNSFWCIYKIYGLMKFDLSKNVRHNVRYINRYNIQIKREKIASCIIAPVIGIVAILGYASMKVTLSHWALLICALIAATLYCYWLFRKYEKNIASILVSLDEIRELKEG